VSMKQFLNIFVPHFFEKEKIPSIAHPDLLKAIDQIKSCASIEEAMKTALQLLSSKYKSKRFETYIFFYKWFEKDPNKLWQRSGFLHCTQQNYLFRVLMVKSGWLKDFQIDIGYSLVAYVSPHQYLKVYLKECPIAVDPWNFGMGVPLGKYAAGFGSKSLT
jgi:hypothetical protein